MKVTFASKIFQFIRAVLILSFTSLSSFTYAQNLDTVFVEARQRMVEKQMQTPPDNRLPVSNEKVLSAMYSVERHLFVPADLKKLAYQDRPLPIGYEQTISQPYIVAIMTELAQPAENDVVLEVGTGSGYQAAVLAEIVEQVYTIEIVKPLADEAGLRLRELGYENVEVRAGDGYKGWPEHAPFDAIVVTAAPDHIPQPLIDQLKPGGRMIIPVGPVYGVQELIQLVKGQDGTLEKNRVMPVRFVPFTREN